jgi:hypothetical protein
MISGGDYSPNSHTFFKHPFVNQEDDTAYQLDSTNDVIHNQKVVILNKSLI